MSKKTSYFSHDSNARNDEKLLAVRMRLGAEGYGIYFMILERLRDESDYMSIKDYNILAFDFRVSSDKVKSVIEDFDLFVFTEDGKQFYSESFNQRMVPLENIREQRIQAGKKSAEKRAENNTRSTTVENSVNDRLCKNQQSKVKESKLIKEEEITPLIPLTDKITKPKKKAQPDALQMPTCSQDFIRLWNQLVLTPKWRKKPLSALQASLNQLSKYDEKFSIGLIEKAIAGNYQGVVFSNTDDDFLKWKKSTNGTSNDSPNSQKSTANYKDRFKIHS